MDGEPGEITPDIKGTTAEVKNPPTDTIASFNFLLSKYDSAITSERITNPEHGWCLLGLKAGKEKTLGAKPPRITQTIDVPAFENTPLFRQKEGIPVNGLIDFINEEIANSLSPEEKVTLHDQLEQIKKNSKLYKESKAHQNPKKFRSRVAMEANLISKNDAMREMILQQLRAQRAQNGNHEEPSPHDLDVAIWLKAENIMNTRIEFFPPARQKSQNEIQNPVDDTPIDDDIEEELKENFYDGEQEQNDQKDPLIFDPKRFKPQHNADGSQVESTGTPEPNLADVLNEDATPEAQPEDSEALPTSDDTEITVTPEDIARTEAEKEPPKDIIDIKKEDLDENQTEEGEIKTIRATLLNASEQRTDEERAEAEKLVDEYIRLKGFKDLLKLPKKTWWRWTRSRQIDLMRRSMKEKDRGARISAAYSRGTKNDEDKATVERFQAGGFSKDRNERLEVLNTDDPKQKELRQKIVDQFIAPIANGEEMTEGQLQERLAQFISENIKNYEQLQNLFGPDMNKYGELSADFATSILEAGQQAKKAMEAHNKSLAEIDKYIEVSVGNAAGYTTDQRSRVEKWIASARARESKVKVGLGEASRFKGAILNPLFVGVAASIATNVALSGGRMGGRAVGFISLGVGAGLGGLAGGARRYGETGEDMRRHMMETEMGAENLAGGKRGRLSESLRKMTGGSNREELEKIRTRLKATSARSLIEGGSNDVVTGEAQESIQGLLSASNPERVLRRIADINARQRFGAETRTAAITYDNMALDLRDLELGKLALEKHLAELTDGMTSEEKTQLQETRSQFMTDYQTRLMESREDMEASFKRYRLKQALKAGAFGGAIGVAGALGGSFIAEKTLNATPNVRIPGMSVQAPEINAPFTTESLQGVEVGDTTIFREADNSSRIVFPDGTEHLVANSEILKNGNVRIEGALTDEVRDAFEAENFTVKELDPIKRDITLLDSTTPLRDSAVGAHPTSIPEGTAWIQDSAEPSKWDLVIQDLPDDHPNKILIDNAQFDEAGKINYESAIAVVSQTTEQIPGEKVIQTQEVFGTEGLWTKETTQITKREWYAYDTPLSDHNELRAYNSVFDAGNGMKGVEWDMSNMTLGHQNNLNPNPIDVQQVIREGQAGFAFTLPDEQKSIVWVSDLSDGVADGKIRLDPNDFTNRINPTDPNSMKIGELSRIVLNQEKLTQLPTGSLASEVYGHQDVFQLGRNGEMGYVEAGRLVDREDGKILQAFATARGSNPTPSAIGIPVEGPPKTIFDTLVTLDQPIIDTAENPVYELIPPSEHEIYPIPIIPIPRWPLERMKSIDLPPPIGGYYSGATLEEHRRWILENPNSHKEYKKVKDKDGKDIWVDSEGKPVTRDVSREKETIKNYLQKLKETDPNHYEMFQRLSNEIAPMSNETRVAVNIPAWMEGENIYKVLEEYTQQTDIDGNPLNPNLYEINIIVNRKEGDAPDKSVEEINRFIKDSTASGKKFNINYIDVEFKPPFNNVGNARRVITDLTLLRSMNRNSQTASLYIESEDADLINIDRKTVTNIVSKMDSQPHLDAVRGIQDRSPEQMMENDFLFMYRRMQDFKELIIRRQGYRPEVNPNANPTWNRVITGGWNTAYSAEAYALIGGYNPYQTKGEDMIMGERMSMIRGDGTTPNTQVVGKVSSRSSSSPRRYIWEVASGKAAYGESFEDPEVNAEIRNKTPEELMEKISFLSRINDSNKATFSQMINSEYDFIKATTPDFKASQDAVKLALLYLGFKNGDPTRNIPPDYRFTQSGGIEITNWENVESALNGYRERHANQRKPGERTGNSTLKNKPSLKTPENPTPESVMESSVELGSAEKASTRSGSATEKKPSNAVNQDAVIENANAGFVGTFDGVGGHGGGDIASRITANRFAQELGILPPNPTRDEIKEAFQKASRGSSQDIKAFLASHPERPGISDMATTASVVKVFEENGEKYAYILQSGDSRSYTLNSDGTITQISSDQSIIERDIATGTITADEARRINDALGNAQSTDDIRSKNPAWLRYWNERNKVNGVINARGSTPPIMEAIKLNPSVKHIITTSDGVHDNLTPREIALTVGGKNNPSEIASALLEASKRRSNEIHFRAKKDDISVAVLSLDTTAT